MGLMRVVKPTDRVVAARYEAYQEDLALLRFWRRQMATTAGQQAVDKLIYAVIVIHHKSELFDEAE